MAFGWVIKCYYIHVSNINMEQANILNTITEKKQWETPKAEVISNDTVKSGSVFGGPEGSPTLVVGLDHYRS